MTRSAVQSTNKTSWCSTSFGHVATLINGRAYKKSELLDKGTPVLRIQNLNGGDRWYYSDLQLPPDKYCDRGDLLFAWSASFGPYIWDGAKSIYHYHIWRVVPGPKLDKRFAYYLLENLTRSVRDAAHGVAMLHITKGKMEAWKISLPPLSEQKRIAAILDVADDLRAKRRESLAQLDAFLQSIFLDMFGDPVANPMGWEERALKETKSKVQIGPFGSLLHKEDYLTDGVPVVNPMHIVSGKIQAGGEQTVSEHKAATLSNYRLEGGDVVMGRRGEMGRCAVVSDVEVGMLCGTGSLYFRPDPSELSPLFLAWLLSSASMKRHLDGLSQGVTMPNLNQNMINNLRIALPPLDLQRRFAAIVDSVEQQKAKQRAHLDELDTLFASLQSRAFKGEL